MTPDPYSEWDAAYVLGALSVSDRHEFDRHLSGCRSCAQAVNQLAALPGLIAAVPAPSEFTTATTPTTPNPTHHDTTPEEIMSARTEHARTASARPALDSPAARLFIALTRITLGFLYLWAFIDKLFGLGIATSPEDSVLAGQSASAGYLSHTEGALSGMFQALAGNPIVDILFMLGLGAVGAALIAGIGLHLAAVGGTLVMGGIYLSRLPLRDNPVIDEHIVYILVGWMLATIGAGSVLGLGGWWQSLSWVRERRWLY